MDLSPKESTSSVVPAAPQAVAVLASLATLHQQKVNINVGGYKFSTSMSSLCSDPQSMLGVMFGGRHQLVTDAGENDINFCAQLETSFSDLHIF